MSEYNSNHTQSSFEDLTGQTFGHLKVVRRGPNGGKSLNTRWYCLCDCGNPNSILRYAQSLKNGENPSCGCAKRKSLGEITVKEILESANVFFVQFYTFNDCINQKTGKRLIFDFYVDDRYIIEYDGKQHFKFDNAGWNSPQNFMDGCYRDMIKDEWCKKNSVPLIRIPYTDKNNICIEDLIPETSNYLVDGTYHKQYNWINDTWNW